MFANLLDNKRQIGLVMDDDIYVTKISINNVRNISKLEIKLSEEHRRHLIITGKNGSGKSTLLTEVMLYLGNIASNSLQSYDEQKKELDRMREEKIRQPNAPQFDSTIYSIQNWLEQFGGTELSFKNLGQIFPSFSTGKYITAFYPAKRDTILRIPTGIQKVDIKKVYNAHENAGTDFIQYMVNLKADRSFAKDDGDLEEVKKIDQWFSTFETSLFKLFNTETNLKFDRKEYNFDILEGEKQPYNLNQLSDGFSAIFRIVSDLIMRMELQKSKIYDIQGIVLIDEIELHLHVDLQKKILPFLTAFFPRVQFIVTTHSPFVLNSISNATICDLEKSFVTEDLSGYSYGTLIESYFDSDNYSHELLAQFEEYALLSEKTDLTLDEKDHLQYLKAYLNEIPKFISNELALAIRQVQLKHVKARG